MESELFLAPEGKSGTEQDRNLLATELRRHAPFVDRFVQKCLLLLIPKL